MNDLAGVKEEQISDRFGQNPSKLIRQIRWLSIVISLLVICLGCSVIWGWFWDLSILKSIIPNRVAMTVSTAVGLVLGGISLLLCHQRQSQKSSTVSISLYFLTVSAIAFSLITLIEYGFNLDLGTNLLPFTNSDLAVAVKMSPNTALGFLCFNTAILLLVAQYYLTAQILVIIVAAIAVVGLIGHIYGIAIFYGVNSFTGMAIHTAVGLILLALAFLGTYPTKGWMRVITRQEAGGVMARWLLPLVIIIPPALGAIFWVLFQGNVYYLELIVALRIILEMLIFGTIIWWFARKLNKSDRQKQNYYQQLLEAESRFQAIFDQTFQFTGLLKPDGTILEANQTALDFAGISKSDVVNQPFWSAYWWQISPQTQTDLRMAIAKASTGEFVRYPVQVQGKNKTVITIDFSLRPIKDKRGKVYLIIPEGRDISDRIKAEKALQKSEARYKAIVEDQTELICRYRQDYTISYVNDAFCRYFGLDKAKLIDREYTPVVYEADLEKVLQLVASMNQNNQTITVENRVWAKGEVRWTQWNNRMMFDETGKFMEYQAVGRDINTLKEIEAKLRESEEKFRRAFEDAATGKALVAPNGEFIQVNQAFCEIVGYSEAELLNKTFQDITHPEDIDLDLSYVRQMLAGLRRTYQMEKRYFHSSGYVVWVLLNVSIVKDLDNRPMYFISQIQNINQRKRTEARLNDLVIELERSNQELDEFASVVSHDLISPLRKQYILIELILEEYQAVLGLEGKEYLNKVINYNYRMEKLVRSILTYARITTQAQPFVAVSLNEVIEDVLYELELEIAQIKAQIEVDKLPIIKGDRLQLRQLFLNLVQNALKFRSSDKRTTIKISYQKQPDWHQIAVADNGIGFEPEQKSKIFTPFHRLYSRSKYEGTGLGLAICNKIVKRHQGKIVAQSEIDRGATFIISLPHKNH